MKRYFINIPLNEIKDKQKELLEKFTVSHPDIIEDINKTKDLDSGLRKRIEDAVDELSAR